MSDDLRMQLKMARDAYEKVVKERDQIQSVLERYEAVVLDRMRERNEALSRIAELEKALDSTLRLLDDAEARALKYKTDLWEEQRRNHSAKTKGKRK